MNPKRPTGVAEPCGFVEDEFTVLLRFSDQS